MGGVLGVAGAVGAGIIEVGGAIPVPGIGFWGVVGAGEPPGVGFAGTGVGFEIGVAGGLAALPAVVAIDPVPAVPEAVGGVRTSELFAGGAVSSAAHAALNNNEIPAMRLNDFRMTRPPSASRP